MKLKASIGSFIALSLVMGGVATASAEWPTDSPRETLKSGDVIPPTAPRLRGADADVGCGNFLLDWTQSRDNVDPRGALRYDIFMDGALVPGASVTGDFFVELSVDVEPGSTHTFVVRAVDRSGNVSQPSNAKTERDTCP